MRNEFGAVFSTRGSQNCLAILMLIIQSCTSVSSANPDNRPPEETQDLGVSSVMPVDNVWRWDISDHEVHPNSDNFIASIGADENVHPDFGTFWDNAPIGIPYQVVTNADPLVDVVYTAYGDESDAGPYRIPLNVLIEGGASSDGDRHAIGVDKDNNILYELYRAFPQAANWDAASGAKFDLTSNVDRPLGWTSADAAGLPIFPGLIRYEEVHLLGEINHAIRFTVSQSQNTFIWPARHFASSSSDPNRPPMGLRFRLKASFELSSFSEPIQVILRALKKHGMIVADNGSDWYLSGAHDPRWDDDLLRELRRLQGSDFEVVLTVDGNGDPIYPQVTGTLSKPGVMFVQKLDWQFKGVPVVEVWSEKMKSFQYFDVKGVSLNSDSVISSSKFR